MSSTETHEITTLHWSAGVLSVWETGQVLESSISLTDAARWFGFIARIEI